MKQFQVQMINLHISSEWWKQIIQHFIKVGDEIEIRCWREEIAEISQAKQYGQARIEGYEVSINGLITEKLLEELMTENPQDKDIYNKMTKYFTLNIKNELCHFFSEHYGTEVYITIYSNKDVLFF